MLVFWKQKLVFLAVPKTGTSAWEHALKDHASMVVSDPPELKHAPLYRYNHFFRPMFARLGVQDMVLMAVVREPVSWLSSWYRYRQRDFLDGRPTSTKAISFEEFILAYCEDEPPAFANVGSQARFLSPRNNGLRVQKIFAYEDQGKVQRFLEDRLDCKLSVLRHNVSESQQTPLSQKTLSLLTKRCSDDFKLWEEVRTD